MLINDLIDIKTKNVKCILDAVRFHDMITKKDLSSLTDLSFATVSNLSNELKERGILVDSKMGAKRVGRIPNALTLNYECYMVIALDLQLENTLGLAVVNLRNETVSEQLFDITHLKDAKEIISFAKKKFDQFLMTYPVKNLTFIGVGATIPAVFDSSDGKLMLSSVPVYENLHLKDMLCEAFQLPAYVDNIANVCVLAAYTKYQDYKNIACLDVSQGVGVGIISEGILLRGKNGYATEVAHVPIGNPELICSYCGGRGCVETELSINGMIRHYQEIDRALPILEQWNCFVHHMRLGDKKSEDIAQNLGSLTGKLATILINLFDPEVFLVTGYLAELFDRIEPYFYKEVELRCKMSLSRNLKIVIEPYKPKSPEIYKGLCNALYNLWKPLP